MGRGARHDVLPEVVGRFLGQLGAEGLDRRQTLKGHLCGFAPQKCDSSRPYINIDPVRIARFARFCATKCY